MQAKNLLGSVMFACPALFPYAQGQGRVDWPKGPVPQLRKFCWFLAPVARLGRLSKFCAARMTLPPRNETPPDPSVAATIPPARPSTILKERQPDQHAAKTLMADSLGDDAPDLDSYGDGPLPNFPGYKVLGILGVGGMGRQCTRHGMKSWSRVVALKMVKAGEHAGAATLARFRGESEAVKRLQHPNIVQIYEIGEHDGLPFFALEFCPGGTLDKKLAQQNLAAARQTMAAADSRPVHRDPRRRHGGGS